VEINAGRYYLRALRADDRIDDRQTIIEAFADPESRRWLSHLDIADLAHAQAYITRRAEGWVDETRFSWAVADPLTGDLLGEVLLKDVDLAAGTAEAGCWAHPKARGRGMTTEALGAILQFGFGALGLKEIIYKYSTGNTASRRVADKLGFTVMEEDADGTILVLHNN
jgi:RimJ/RimL family protein N-acetyltransferase